MKLREPGSACRSASAANNSAPIVHRSRGYSVDADRAWSVLDGARLLLPEFLVEVQLSQPSGASVSVSTGRAAAALEALPADVRHVCRDLASMLALADEDDKVNVEAAACPSRLAIGRACELEPQVCM